MIYVRKANGEREEFHEQKVLDSVRRAGAPENIQQEVLRKVKENLYTDIPTSEIYTQIIESLNSTHPHSGAKYTLKEAIMMLGPTGYPFEDFVSKILMEDGYQTRVRQTMFGKCVSHEIDVVAEKDNKVAMVEAKFHNNPGTRSEIHVALYTYARFQDIKDKFQLSEPWIITNTKATTDAIAYANCVGMKIISWSYPEGNSLREMIERSHLHPITLLTTLSATQKANLLRRHIVICKDLRGNPELLDPLSLNQNEKDAVLQELETICG